MVRGWWMVGLGALVGAWGQEALRVSLGKGLEDWRRVPEVGMEVRSEQVPRADGERPALRLSFRKAGQERRLLAWEAKPQGSLEGMRALVLRYRLSLSQGSPPRPVLMLFEADGGVWLKVGMPLQAEEGWNEARLPLGGLRPAAFGRDEDGALQWEKVEGVRWGFAFDGPAQGRLEVSQAFLTREPYRPAAPLRITHGGPGVWSLAKDPAVKATLSTPNEGPEGKPCMKFVFVFPGGRHMYALPTIRVPEAELEGYRGLRFTYRATLPPGIQGLLVTVHERDGSQYYADPPPPPSPEWRTVVLPFETFRLGGWSKDENGRLDIDQISAVVIGAHGTAAGVGGEGILWVVDVELVP